MSCSKVNTVWKKLTTTKIMMKDRFINTVLEQVFYLFWELGARWSANDLTTELLDIVCTLRSKTKFENRFSPNF